ncbi:MAG: hypothetical protein ABIN36_08465 [Ferruginibacter sp.]
MKKITLCILLFSCTLSAYNQPLPDSTKAIYYTAKTDKEKGNCLLNYFRRQVLNDAKTKANILLLKSWFEKQNDQVGKNYTSLGLAMILEKNGDFPGSLNLLFWVLPQFEQRKDSFGMFFTYQLIANTYMSAKDFLQAAKYSKKEIDFVNNDKNLLSKVYNGIACIYGEGKMPDSGMVYAQKAVKMDAELKNDFQLAISTSTLAENYIAAGAHDIALPFLRRTAGYYKRNGAPSPYMDAYLKNDFAEVFLATKMYDSSNYYSRQALSVSVPSDIKDQSMRSYEYLYKSFEQTNQNDSLNKYFRLTMLTKDSLLSIEKVKSIQALTFQEQLRQQEAEGEKIKSEQERKENIQYALIGLSILTFIIIFLVLSRRHITNTKLIQFLSIVALLVVFEFLNLLLHPFLEKITHHSPVLMLLSLVLIAALLVPFHHKLEHWATHKLVEKNKAIRLAKAKKTIEELDNSKQ